MNKSLSLKNPNAFFILVGLIVSALLPHQAGAQTTLYWTTNATNASWNSSNWGTNADGPFTTVWTASSDVVFNAPSSSLTNFTTTIGNITVNANTTITAGGTVSSKSGGSVVNVADGVTLTWASQNRSVIGTNNIWTKSGSGIWVINGGTTSDPSTGAKFTLNEGTVVVTGQRAFGGPNSILTINGGTIQSSGGITFANSNVIIGGNFTFTGSGNDNYTGAVSLGSFTRTITNSASGLRIFSGTISGDGAGLTLAGTGTTVLAGSNTYNGATTVAGGVLQISNVNALQSSTLNMSNGSVAFTVTGSNTYSLGGLAGTNNLNIGGNALSVGANNANTTYGGRFTNASASAGSLIKVGSGTLTLTGSNSFTGATTVNSGTLQIGDGTDAGTIASSSGVSISNGAKLAYNFAGARAFSNAISGDGSLIKSGVGTLTLSANNTYSGGTTLNGGSLVLSSNGTLGSVDGAVNISAGTIDLGNNTRTNASLTISGGGLSNGTLVASNYALNGGTVGASLGGGKITVGGTSALNGTAAAEDVNITAGTLTLGSGSRLTNAPTVAISNAATLALGGAESVRSIAGAGLLNLGASTLTVGAGGASSQFSGRIDGSGGGLTKVGSGTLTLSGSNAYSGQTIVNDGRLAVNGTNTGAVLVSSNGVLGGSGVIGGAVTLNGGTLAPGNSIESLAVGDLTFTNGATFAVELDSRVDLSLAADFVKVSGGLNLYDTVYLTLTDLAGSNSAPFSLNTTFTLINYSGTWNNGLFTYGSDLLTNNSTFNDGLNTWQITYDATIGGTNYYTEYFGGSSRYVNITAVPEPSTYALLILSAAGLAAHVIRRRHRQG